MLASALTAAGAGIVAAGLVRTRLAMADRPNTVDVALGVEEAPESAAGAGLLYRAAEPVLRLASDLGRGIAPSTRVDLMRRRIIYAGLEGQLQVERVLAYQVASALIGLMLAVVVTPGVFPSYVWWVVGLMAGAMVPDLMLGAKAKKRQAEVARDLPEALDLLAITVEAGLGLEAALEIVTDNITGPLAVELTRVLREIELGVPRHDALVGLRERTDVPELSGFVVALIQADQMGVAVADVLKVQAHQVRVKRHQRAREQAAKAPVKILFPLIFGILPSIFVVTIGPGIINIAGSLFKQ